MGQFRKSLRTQPANNMGYVKNRWAISLSPTLSLHRHSHVREDAERDLVSSTNQDSGRVTYTLDFVLRGNNVANIIQSNIMTMKKKKKKMMLIIIVMINMMILHLTERRLTGDKIATAYPTTCKTTLGRRRNALLSPTSWPVRNYSPPLALPGWQIPSEADARAKASNPRGCGRGPILKVPIPSVRPVEPLPAVSLMSVTFGGE